MTRQDRWLRRSFSAWLLMLAMPVAAQSSGVFSAGFDRSADRYDADAARFLTQSTFGPTFGDIAHLRAIGNTAWIDEQMALPATHHLPRLLPSGDYGDYYTVARQEAWFRTALDADDQLRQRVAFALSEIMVVSDRGALAGQVFSLTSYYDMLVDGAFGNYRDLLENVTLHPAMGVYLSMLGNERPDPVANVRPDENYAREVMQLFSIGLEMLNLDGSIKDGDAGTPGIQPIPAYDQFVVKGLAHVFTGWNWLECANPENWNAPWEVLPDIQATSGWRSPMQAWAGMHDDGEKQLMSYSGAGLGSPIVLPAGGTPEAGLQDALDVLFNHPNVGPFISRQLILRLVTSNPSPAYIARVAGIFNNNGSGVRGDLAAVVRAILLDPEARAGDRRLSETGGKLREPLIRVTHMLRALNAVMPTGRVYPWGPEQDYGQAALRSPSVFNFFTPHYSLPGEISQRGLVSPEFQITTDTTIVSTTNQIAANIYWAYLNPPDTDDYDGFVVDLGPEEPFGDDPAALVSRYDLLFMNGWMSPGMRQLLIDHVAAMSNDEWHPDYRRERVQDALVLILTSPQYAVQK
ncbi:MAG: DUF1800 domain-containing protein [Xanthomonadales bacterium]|nr:DUF1800 domain-containing protein [Xanthomonadales bacterium]